MAVADTVVLAVLAVLAGLYYFRSTLFGAKSISAPYSSSSLANGAVPGADDGDSDDLAAKMKKTDKRIAILYGSQTGTAEEYSYRIAKEIKAKYGVSPLVFDPENISDFATFDELPEDSVVVFVVATYGEGEPTDNLVPLMDYFKERSEPLNFSFVCWALGNSSYVHYCQTGRDLDDRLQKLGARRIGERGEGDDDKSMEEDYLAWKDGMLTSLGREMNLEEGGGGDVQDYEIKELAEHEDAKVYKGELSARTLFGTKGIHDAKNPYIAPVASSKELFSAGERTCVHMEFDIEGSGISYQHGDHIAIWAHNPEREVERMLAILGLAHKRDTVVNVISLDPALSKVPFPVPTTYEAVFRYYLDVAGRAGRQALAGLARFAPNDAIRAEMEKIGNDKEYFHERIAKHYYTVAEALQVVAGDNVDTDDFSQATTWNIPFDRIISAVPRVGPRFYSISSSPKLHPKTVHITAVVLRYAADQQPNRYVHGLATNFISSIKMDMNEEKSSGPNDPRHSTPKYDLTGPRGIYTKDQRWRCPVHIRRSNFRLPTSPKVPVIMIGPGTGVAPFRSFVQERVAGAQKTKEKNGPDALSDWGNIWLFYGCRKSSEDFLYSDEWPEYSKALGDKFKMETAISREKFKPDGSKMYVQDLIWENRQALASEILEKKATIYICGDAAGMAHDVEKVLMQIVVDAKGGDKEAAQKEIGLMKSRGKYLLDIWS